MKFLIHFHVKIKQSLFAIFYSPNKIGSRSFFILKIKNNWIKIFQSNFAIFKSSIKIRENYFVYNFYPRALKTASQTRFDVRRTRTRAF